MSALDVELFVLSVIMENSSTMCKALNDPIFSLVPTVELSVLHTRIWESLLFLQECDSPPARSPLFIEGEAPALLPRADIADVIMRLRQVYRSLCPHGVYRLSYYQGVLFDLRNLCLIGLLLSNYRSEKGNVAAVTFLTSALKRIDFRLAVAQDSVSKTPLRCFPQ